MSKRDIAIIVVEYEQLGENLRTTWKYISDLLRMWVAFEVLSIILVLVCIHIHQQIHISTDHFSKFFVGAIVFSALAGCLSFGAGAQNGRLFRSALKFVDRAAMIEEKTIFDPEDPKKRKYRSQFIYMRDELYKGKRFELARVLSWIYFITFALWVVIIFLIPIKLFIMTK